MTNAMIVSVLDMDTSLVPRRFGLFTSLSARGTAREPYIDQINPRDPRKGRASLEQHIAPGYEAV